MKKMLLAAVTSLFIWAFAPIKELSIGEKLPMANVPMQDVSGKTMTLADAKTSNGLLVMFSCNTCPYVVKNQQRTQSILSYAQSKQVGVAVLNSNEDYRTKDDSFEAMQAYAKAQGYQWMYAVDAKHAIADAFGATRTPECFLFDGTGKLVYHGAIDDSPADASAIQRQHLKEALDDMLSGQAVRVATSRSIGCSIKRIATP